MTRRALLYVTYALMGLIGLPGASRAQTVQTCPDPNACAQVSVEGGSGSVNSTVTAKLSFKQGPSTAAAGGIDEIAAIALTLRLGDGTGTPLVLADNCALDGDGFPGAVHPDAALSNFKVVIENASCAGGRTHCLCPDAGQTRDNFINIVVYGPNPLPTPGPNPIDIPVLPSGPPQMLSIDLTVQPGASGTIPLHVFNQAADGTHPQFTALLSVGDKLAVDQTCVPVVGQPPCSAAGSVSQVAITDGSIAVVPGQACTGDCNMLGSVTVDEILTMVNIALDPVANPITLCEAGDANQSGTITVDEILAAVNFSLTMCPTS